MKSFSEVLASSKKSVLEAKAAQIDREKVMLLEAIKSDMMIEGKLIDLPQPKQHQVLNILLEYWSPKSGINNAGIKFLDKGQMTIDSKSSKENIKLYAEKEIKEHINEFMSMFSQQRGQEAVNILQEKLEQMTGKKINTKVLFESAMTIISNKIAEDNKIRF